MYQSNNETGEIASKYINLREQDIPHDEAVNKLADQISQSQDEIEYSLEAEYFMIERHGYTFPEK